MPTSDSVGACMPGDPVATILPSLFIGSGCPEAPHVHIRTADEARVLLTCGRAAVLREGAWDQAELVVGWLGHDVARIMHLARLRFSALPVDPTPTESRSSWADDLDDLVRRLYEGPTRSVDEMEADMRKRGIDPDELRRQIYG